MTKNIHLYSTKDCPHCMELKQLLNNNNIPYEITDVDEEEKVWDELCETLNVKFVPTVIIVDETKDTAKILTPDIHFDEVDECFEQILEEVNDNGNS
jgi:glutaredoxin|tara:strand:+ start:1440 stop:1730 length:291 start_codon:yes stop_codon:yes gene_type:complete